MANVIECYGGKAKISSNINKSISATTIATYLIWVNIDITLKCLECSGNLRGAGTMYKWDSIGLDVKILLKTVYVVLARKGAM